MQTGSVLVLLVGSCSSEALENRVKLHTRCSWGNFLKDIETNSSDGFSYLEPCSGSMILSLLQPQLGSVVFGVIHFWICCWSDNSLQCLGLSLRGQICWVWLCQGHAGISRWHHITCPTLPTGFSRKTKLRCHWSCVTGCSVLSSQPYPAWKQTGERWGWEKGYSALLLPFCLPWVAANITTVLSKVFPVCHFEDVDFAEVTPLNLVSSP